MFRMMGQAPSQCCFALEISFGQGEQITPKSDIYCPKRDLAKDTAISVA
jgi:hypothetical protein